MPVNGKRKSDDAQDRSWKQRQAFDLKTILVIVSAFLGSGITVGGVKFIDSSAIESSILENTHEIKQLKQHVLEYESSHEREEELTQQLLYQELKSIKTDLKEIKQDVKKIKNGQ